MDEKCFRDELVRFTVDDQGSIIDEKHRADVMPILLRYLCLCDCELFVVNFLPLFRF